LGKKAVPFAEWIGSIDGAEDGDEMIFQSSDGTFGGVDSMFMRRNALELDFVFQEGCFEILGTFVVKDMEFRRVSLLDEQFVGGLPCIANDGCGLAIGNGDGMDVVGILMVENEEVVVASGGRDGELACLIRVALQERLVMKKDSTDVMSARSKIWGQIEVRIGRIVKDKLSRANAARFLILMA
jgi:hypothetical protein